MIMLFQTTVNVDWNLSSLLSELVVIDLDSLTGHTDCDTIVSENQNDAKYGHKMQEYIYACYNNLYY